MRKNFLPVEFDDLSLISLARMNVNALAEHDWDASRM
jgi:hypothetical protein